MKKVRKAVFPVAGFGTRFLPVTKAMPKELLPIVDKPLIQYAAEEAVNAGIETLIFVTGRNKRAIEDHFDHAPELERKLRNRAQSDEADMVKNIVPQNVDCIFVRQSEQLGLGHAILCSKSIVGEEPFAVLLADDFICNENGNVTKDLINKFNETGNSQISVTEVEGSDITKYGAIISGPTKNSVAGLIEKPKFEDAPSNKASIGRYVLKNDIFELLSKAQIDNTGEIQLADSIHILASRGEVGSVDLKGKRFDCGSVEGFMEAINYEYSKRVK